MKSTQKPLQELEVQIDKLCEELSLVQSSSSTANIQSSTVVMIPVDDCGIHGLRGEPLMVVEHEEVSGLHELEDRNDSDIPEFSHNLYHCDHESPLRESQLRAQDSYHPLWDGVLPSLEDGT